MTQTHAFWDSSALVPACVHQLATARARPLLQRLLPVVWWATTVEVHGAICRLHRSQEITESDKQNAIARMRVLALSWREILPDDEVRDLASGCLDRYSLRAADALQLGAALVWCQQRPSRRTLITGDQRLAEAATSIGFSVTAFP